MEVVEPTFIYDFVEVVRETHTFNENMVNL